MKCPYCELKLKVIDTESRDRVTIRVRVCLSCNRTWFTEEPLPETHGYKRSLGRK